MKILIFSWRDIKNPQAGGAEVLTHEITKRWANQGHQVSLVASQFAKSKSRETVDGVTIFRPARFDRYSPFLYLTFLLKTTLFYRKNLKGQHDIIIDQVHGLPMLTPLYVREKVILFPLEVARDIWRYEIPFPFWPIGWLLESVYLRYFRNRPFWAISPSTIKDLKARGIKRITLITPGLDFPPLESIPVKSKNPLIVSLGRLTPMKRIEQTLMAFALVLKKAPRAKLVIIGRGKAQYLKKLQKRTQDLKIQSNVKFTGFVSDKERKKWLSQAWVLVSTSLREGWGLIVIEAAACGTPSVVYRVPGLIDSVKNNQTGVICRQNSPEILANNLLRLFSDSKKRRALSSKALIHSRRFDWEKTAQDCLAALKKTTNPPLADKP
jgi:glycosyltransferase involved in cell wall biosynthesis